MKFLDTDDWLTERLSWGVPALLGGTGAPVTITPPLTLRVLGALLPAHPTPVGRPSSGIKWIQTLPSWGANSQCHPAFYGRFLVCEMA